MPDTSRSNVRQRSNPEFDDPSVARARFMVVLSYNGSAFFGWQIQPNQPSVQETLENALQIALKVPLHVVGAGRTDTGVNARTMTAHFDLPATRASQILEPQAVEKLKYTLNAILKPSITIHHVFPVENDVHARFDAKSRTYRYYLHTVPDPFRSDSSRYFPRSLDFDKMNREAESLIGTHDFTSFSKLHTDTTNNFCTVRSARWVAYGPNHYYFEITANRFLRNMVRAVVGTLLDVGIGKYEEGHIAQVMSACDRCSAGVSVPGYALYLWDIEYDFPLPKNPLPN